MPDPENEPDKFIIKRRITLKFYLTWNQIETVSHNRNFCDSVECPEVPNGSKPV